MKNFRKLFVWKKGMEIAKDCYQIVSTFPREEKYGLSLQITRSGTSIPSNIAEGSSRRSDKEYNHFLEISLGSAFELETQLLISLAANYGNPEEINHLLAKVDEEQKMLMSFMNIFKIQ